MPECFYLLGIPRRAEDIEETGTLADELMDGVEIEIGRVEADAGVDIRGNSRGEFPTESQCAGLARYGQSS